MPFDNDLSIVESREISQLITGIIKFMQSLSASFPSIPESARLSNAEVTEITQTFGMKKSKPRSGKTSSSPTKTSSNLCCPPCPMPSQSKLAKKPSKSSTLKSRKSVKSKRKSSKKGKNSKSKAASRPMKKRKGSKSNVKRTKKAHKSSGKKASKIKCEC
ncbi:CLUMA_CG019441, isoform A [Clunio marinus]|uniref:CLUMA_CG019441, isoform A n=1 Tax=Clunio marinus TaxID=568069 RepID=A0A1J1J2J4_9DIPT|nr:CLUMA_CG019441, isoform A [Clunio marinus]